MFNPQLPLIDCRSQDDFTASHIDGATHIPSAELFHRMHELPMRNVALQLCGCENSTAQAKAFLSDKGYDILYSQNWDKELFAEQGLPLISGSNSRRLWQPAGIVEFFEQHFGAKVEAAKQGLDIGCGAGRDLVYLATQGWQMTGIDYHQDALERANALAHYNQTEIKGLALDLEKGTPELLQLKQEFDLVCVVRYLHRPLFEQIKAIIKPGGFIVYQTFMQGCEKISRPRNPNFLLKPGELAQTFSGYNILLDEVEHLSDGRPVARFIAQKS